MFSSFSADTEEEYQTEFTFIFPNFNWQTGLSWVHNVQSQKLIYLINNEINEILRVFLYLFPFLYIYLYFNMNKYHFDWSVCAYIWTNRYRNNIFVITNIVHLK